MKTCSQCKQSLPLESFNKQSTGKQGRRADCKDCFRRFTRSKEGLVKQTFSQQKAKAKKRGYAAPAYTQHQLFEWAVNQPKFHQLYAEWEASGYQSNLKPSFDRLNDYVSYRLDNLQILTWGEHSQKYYASAIEGDNNKQSSAVDMLDMDGNFIRRFHSVAEAARQFNGNPANIAGVCMHRVITRKNPDGSTRTWTQTTAYGHKWRYSLIPNDNLEKHNADVHRMAISTDRCL